jgi:hypothetical protein
MYDDVVCNTVYLYKRETDMLAGDVLQITQDRI